MIENLQNENKGGFSIDSKMLDENQDDFESEELRINSEKKMIMKVFVKLTFLFFS